MGQRGSEGGPVRRTRRYERYQLVRPVILQDAERRADGRILFDTVNLSAGGAYLESQLLLDVDDELDVRFTLSDDGPALVARCRVVRVSRGSPPGMGVEFSRLSDDDRERIITFLEKGPR